MTTLPSITADELLNVLIFVLDENSDSNNPPSLLTTNPQFYKIRNALMGYDASVDPPLKDLVNRVAAIEADFTPAGGTGLVSRVAAVENILVPTGTGTIPLATRVTTVESNFAQAKTNLDKLDFASLQPGQKPFEELAAIKLLFPRARVRKTTGLKVALALDKANRPHR